MMIVASNNITVSNINDGTIVHIAYANSADGTDGFYVGGGTNLLTGTSEDEVSGKSYEFARYTISGGLQPETTYTLSGLARVDQKAMDNQQYVAVFAYAGDWSWNIKLAIHASLTSNYKNVTFTTPSGKQFNPTVGVYLYHPNNDPSQDSISGLGYISKLKLEKGSVATPWSPAPSEAHPIYMGTYTDFTQADSLDPTAYQWSQIKGADGKDGVGIKSTIITYQLSSSGTTTPTGTWSTTVPTLVKGQYLWTRTTLVYTDNTTEDVYSVSYVAKDGNDGTDGVAGKDGVGIKSTTITYQSGTSGTVQPTGTWVDNPPSVTDGNYLWTRTIWNYTDGTSETGYSVAKAGEKGDKGADGAQGIPGSPGADGKTSYLHIAYANSADGSGCVTSPDINSSYNYIGTYTDYTSTSSTDPSSYTWVPMFDSTKKRNFTTQPTTPYSVGDTWTQYGATYFCTTARASGAFTAADWTMQQLTITSLASDVQTDLTNNVKTNKTYKGVTLNDAGLTATAGSTTVAMNSSDGFLIQKGTTQLLHADTAGNLTMAGNITAGNISGVNFIGDNLSLAGSLKVTGSILSGNGKVALSNTGVTIKGAGFNLGDSSGNTTVSMKDDGTFLANKAVLSGSLTSNAVTITGGDINMNGGKFHVDTQGNVTATSFTDTSRLDKGTIDFTNMTVDGLSANYIQTGILKGITLQGNTIIAGDGTITTQLDNNGFSQKSNDQFYNQVFNSEFLCSGQNWDMSPGVYVTNIAPTKDYSNRVAINPGTYTLEAGNWSSICSSLSIPINPNGKYSFSSIVGIINDTPSNYDNITATLVWQDDNKKDLGHSDISYDVNSRELQYLKKENITPIAGATHVMFRWNVHAPASATGSGHIVFTQPYVTPYATCGVYRPGNVSSNNQINIKDGYIEFPIPDTYRSPSIVENASGYAGYDIVATGRGFLSAEGMFINAQVHKKDSSDVAGTNIYTESMSLSPTGMTLSIINNYKNSNNLVATIDPTKGIANEFWTDNQVVRGSALSLQTLNLDGGTLTQYEDAKHGLDIYNSTGTNFSLGNDGRPYCLSNDINNRTYSNSSNVYVTGNGALGRATSASKYKLAISDLYQASDKAHMFLAVKPKQWFDKEETDEFANDISGVGNYIDVPSVNTYAGFIAEDLEVAGLEEFVQRGTTGDLEGINYDRLPVLHHQLLREAYDRIDYLETQLYLLKKKVDSL